MIARAAANQNPFPGLRPFREDEERVFFGRENQVNTMVNELARTRFLAVLGTSGSGKSSLVNCGLRPALHRGLMAGAGPAWRMAQFRPGSDPIQSLAEALAARPGPSGPAGAAALERAARLYRDDFLGGFSLRDCPEFEDWQSSTAEDHLAFMTSRRCSAASSPRTPRVRRSA